MQEDEEAQGIVGSEEEEPEADLLAEPQETTRSKSVITAALLSSAYVIANDR